ncbi:MAG TPA: hypothetical protein VKG85_11930 [Actinomycetes bacterium]|nr:hypothetical protein [Actinomycetes bacterium]
MTSAAEVYGSFIDDELRGEIARKASLEARGLAVVTSSASLITAILAVGLFVSGQETFAPKGISVGLLIAALAAFICSALLGLLSNRVMHYLVLSVPSLRLMLNDHWRDDVVEARAVVALAHIGTIETVRAGNDQKARLLIAGVAAQLTAAILVSGAVASILLEG